VRARLIGAAEDVDDLNALLGGNRRDGGVAALPEELLDERVDRYDPVTVSLEQPRDALGVASCIRGAATTAQIVVRVRTSGSFAGLECIAHRMIIPVGNVELNRFGLRAGCRTPTRPLSFHVCYLARSGCSRILIGVDRAAC
jgi:hypothetical protein